MKRRPRLEVLDLSGMKWDGGAPMPQLLAGTRRATVLCYESPETGGDECLMEICFDGCSTVRMGHPNDEVLHAHPLYRCGMKFYEAHLVHNSPWLDEHRRMNSVHEAHSDATWASLNHYFLAFHDEVVEAIAQGISARRLEGDMASELARVAREMAADV